MATVEACIRVFLAPVYYVYDGVFVASHNTLNTQGWFIAPSLWIVLINDFIFEYNVGDRDHENNHAHGRKL